jgi:hypothetical protein
MKRLAFLADMLRASLFAAVMLASVGHASAGPITLNLVDYPTLQNGWTLSGSITLDMAGTSLSSGDIVSWSYTLTNGGQMISASSADSGAIGAATGTFSATTTELRLPSGSAIVLEDGNQTLEYNFGASGVVVYRSDTDVNPQTIFQWQAFNPDLDTNADGWLVASVPEPASLTLLGLGVASLAGYAWRRRG